MGIGERGRGALYSHDAFSALVFNVGYVPLLGGVAALSFLLFKLHRRQFAAPAGPERRAFEMLLAVVFAICCTGLSGNTAFRVFPINLYMWFAIGGCASIFIHQFSALTRSEAKVGSGVVMPEARAV